MLEVELDEALSTTTFLLEVDTTTLRNKVSSTYWRPFSAYYQGKLMKSDLKTAKRWTVNPNEYYYYLHWLLKSPNAPETSTVKIKANNLLYVFHDLLHAENDVIGDTMAVSRETEALRLRDAITENAKQGFDPFDEDLLVKIERMYNFNIREKDIIQLNLKEHQNKYY